ncbi:MAG TPA: type I-E CRISPR-associated protein Cse1/CasA [Pseudonocardiaceae bacterium]|nr:type I-E CRISPR-associated protein Cse1/CasA [Pseudonocardiaceae bacterium]
MSGDDARSFDLIDRPWILARGLDGDIQELSLIDVFTRASELECLVGEVPTQVFALTRLLLAILHRSIEGPRDLDHWEELWQQAELPVDAVKGYVDRHRARFDLLHPRTPFLQVAELHTDKGETSELAKLIADVPNGRQFFTARPTRELSLDFGEAARWVVHCHAFDPSGIKSGAVGDPRVKNGKGYPIGTGWSGYLGGVLVEGATLRETLLLNLLAHSFGELHRWIAADRPAWERPPAGPQPASPDGVTPDENTDAGDRPPTGPLDLYTWQSRRIRLDWRDDMVTGALICNGDRITQQNRHHLEPHTAWRRSDPQEKKLKRPLVYMPDSHRPQRALWRGLQSLLPGAVSTQGKDAAPRLTPMVLNWLGLLADEVIGLDYPVRIRAIGMTYGSQNSVTEDITDDTLELGAHLLRSEATELVDVAIECVRAADAVARAVGTLAGSIALAKGGESDGPRTRAMELAYGHLDVEFREWLAKLAPDTDATTAQTEWHGRAKSCVGELGRDEIHNAPMVALTGRMVNGRLLTAAHAEARFYRELRAALPLAFVDTPSQNGSPA